MIHAMQVWYMLLCKYVMSYYASLMHVNMQVCDAILCKLMYVIMQAYEVISCKFNVCKYASLCYVYAYARWHLYAMFMHMQDDTFILCLCICKMIPLCNVYVMQDNTFLAHVIFTIYVMSWKRFTWVTLGVNHMIM